MKVSFSVIAVLLTMHSATAQINTPCSYVVLQDSVHDNAKMLVGIIHKNDLNSDSAFDWYEESQRIYPHPDTNVVNAFRNNKDKIYFLIFGGTWCMDTHFILPKFYKIQEASGLPEDHITVFAVDHHMHTTGNLAKVLNIRQTPTIVVMKDGKELGRLVEYGKTGHWDEELAAIINQD